METNQKNREARQRRPAAQEQQAPKKRRPAAEEQQAPRKRRPAAEEQQMPKKRRPAAEEQQAPKKRRPVAQEQQAPKKRRPVAQEQQEPRKRRPVAEEQQTPQKRRPAAEEQPRRSAAQERSAARRNAQPENPQSAFRREEGVQYTAPQGTGPRKSAPQRSPQERAAQPKRSAAQPRKQKKSGLQGLIDSVRGEKDSDAPMSEQAKKRQEQRAAKAEKRRKQAERNNTPAIIYTQPQAFNRNRLFVQLLTVTAVVVALVLGLSVFFKVEAITVSGAEVYSAWAVREASGIQEGDNLLTFSRARATAQITAKLPYVEKARIGIKLPETVIIYIEEMDVAYAIKSDQGAWWLMNSNGRLVEPINDAAAKNYTQVEGVTLADPVSGEIAVAAELIPVETAAQDATGTTEATEAAPVTVTGAQRLYAALQILKALEANDIVGEAASVNVTRMEDIILWYGSRYQVNLGDTSNMEYKIACMNDVILQMSDYDSGVLDLSFTNFGDQVGYTPFE